MATSGKSPPGQDAPRSQTLRVERLSPGGDGVCRDDSGRVVFVPFVAPGDRVRVELTEEHTRFARGRVVELLEAGPDRTDPVCPAFGDCGGCSWQHVSYPAQVEQKRAFIRDAFERIGHLEVPEPLEVVPCPVDYGYRIRTRVAVQGRAVGYRKRRSHALCATERCPVLVPALERELARLPGRARGRPGDWWLAAGADGQVAAAPVRGAQARAVRAGAPRRVQLRVAGRALECGLGGFSQSNGPLFETVAAAVVAAAGRSDAVVELFAGAGYLTLGLAERFGRVLAVEGDSRSLRDLERNCQRAGIENVEIVAASVEDALRRAPVQAAAPDVVVLDPPRTGLPAGTVEDLAALHAPRIVYLSCDPATLARDAAALHGHGYDTSKLLGFDLFPQTPHVEVLAVLTRR